MSMNKSGTSLIVLPSHSRTYMSPIGSRSVCPPESSFRKRRCVGRSTDLSLVSPSDLGKENGALREDPV